MRSLSELALKYKKKYWLKMRKLKVIKCWKFDYGKSQ